MSNRFHVGTFVSVISRDMTVTLVRWVQFRC